MPEHSGGVRFGGTSAVPLTVSANDLDRCEGEQERGDKQDKTKPEDGQRVGSVEFGVADQQFSDLHGPKATS